MRFPDPIPQRLYFSRRFKPSDWEGSIVHMLQQRHIYAIINLWHKPDPIARSAVTEYHMNPLPDGKLLSTDEWIRLAALGAFYVTTNRPLLIQCYGGKNRSALLAGLIYAMVMNVSGENALLRLRVVRPRAISNKSFEAFLLSLYPGQLQEEALRVATPTL